MSSIVRLLRGLKLFGAWFYRVRLWDGLVLQGYPGVEGSARLSGGVGLNSLLKVWMFLSSILL